MTTSIWSRINNTYFLACVTATIALHIYCAKRYFENENITEVKYTKFHSSNDSIYPSFSICILPPFIENRFDVYGNGINMTSYSDFLKGGLWDERMLDIDYDNVTTSMSDNLLGAKLELRKPYGYEYITPDPEYFVSFRSGWRKCFTINMSFFIKSALTGFGST